MAALGGRGRRVFNTDFVGLCSLDFCMEFLEIFPEFRRYRGFYVIQITFPQTGYVFQCAGVLGTGGRTCSRINFALYKQP